MPARSDAARREHIRRVVAWIVLACSIVLQLWGLYAPEVPDGGDIPGSDKLGHVAMFALVMASGVVAGIPGAVLAIVLVAQAVVTVQGVLLSMRSGDVWDGVADVVGIALGWAVAYRWAPARARRRAAVGEG